MTVSTSSSRLALRPHHRNYQMLSSKADGDLRVAHSTEDSTTDYQDAELLHDGREDEYSPVKVQVLKDLKPSFHRST